MEVKTYTEGKLHCYKLVAGKPEVGSSETKSGTSQERLHKYLNWAARLLEGQESYCLLRYTPDLEAKPFAEKGTHTFWQYHVVSNDFTGLGVDKGFLRPTDAEKESTGAGLLFRLPSPGQLKELPEDMFGDFASHVSFFGLRSDRAEELAKLLASEESPALEKWLQEEDLFLHITVGKEQGYYDTFLIKSCRDLDDRVKQLS